MMGAKQTEFEKLIEKGEIDDGMTPYQVMVAWGEPKYEQERDWLGKDRKDLHEVYV